MCPECFPNLAVVIAGLTSTSWMTALVANFGTSINRTPRAQAAILEAFRHAPSRDDMPKTRTSRPAGGLPRGRKSQVKPVHLTTCESTYWQSASSGIKSSEAGLLIQHHRSCKHAIHDDRES
jgi:hypothetical protein